MGGGEDGGRVLPRSRSRRVPLGALDTRPRLGWFGLATVYWCYILFLFRTVICGWGEERSTHPQAPCKTSRECPPFLFFVVPVAFFGTSGLPQTSLRKIWTLADTMVRGLGGEVAEHIETIQGWGVDGSKKMKEEKKRRGRSGGVHGKVRWTGRRQSTWEAGRGR